MYPPSRAVDMLIKFTNELLTVHVIPLTCTLQTLLVFKRNPHLRTFLRKTVKCWRGAGALLDDLRMAVSSRATGNTVLTTSLQARSNVNFELINCVRRGSFCGVERSSCRVEKEERRLRGSISAPQLQWGVSEGVGGDRAERERMRARSKSEDVCIKHVVLMCNTTGL